MQILPLRTEMRAEFSAVRGEMAEQGKGLRAEMAEQTKVLRAEIAEQGKSLGTQMRVLHEEVISRIALIQEGMSARPRRPRRKDAGGA